MIREDFYAYVPTWGEDEDDAESMNMESPAEMAEFTLRLFDWELEYDERLDERNPAALRWVSECLGSQHTS